MEAVKSRLAHQLDLLPFVLGKTSEETLSERPSPGKWSAREHLAHLARHHEVMTARLERIRKEERPHLERYSAEQDPGWVGWRDLALPRILERLLELRAVLLGEVGRLADADERRVGIHEKYGPMDMTEWLQFFLLHEAHHLYVIMVLRGNGRSS